MKKSTLIFIVVIYIASIAIISFFGTKIAVYNEIVPVTSIECINESDDLVEVEVTSEGKMILKTKFTQRANKENFTGTMLQIVWKVLPDDATIKNVKFVYDETNNRVEFYKMPNGEYTGLVLFYGKSILDVKIMSTDGRKIYKEITLWAY